MKTIQSKVCCEQATRHLAHDVLLAVVDLLLAHRLPQTIVAELDDRLDEVFRRHLDHGGRHG